MPIQEVSHRTQHFIDVRLVGHADREIQLSNGAKIVKDLPHDFSVRNHDPRLMGCLSVVVKMSILTTSP